MKRFKASAKLYYWAGTIEPPGATCIDFADEFFAEEKMLAIRHLTDMLQPTKDILEGKGMRVRVAANVEEIETKI